MTDETRNETLSAAASAEASEEAAAKDQAASVVMAYREIDWEAVEHGDDAAVDALLSACERHEATRTFLEDQGGPLGERLAGGLERYYAESVGPRMRRPAVLSQLNRPGAARRTGQSDDGLSPRARPTVTVGHTVRMNTGCGHLYVTVNESEDGKPFELFNHMGKAGGCAASQNEAIGRLISYALRCGARIEPLIKQLKGISCHRPAWGEDGKISSCSDAIGKALEKYYSARQLQRQQLGLEPEDTPLEERRQLLAERAALEAAVQEATVERRASSNGGNGHRNGDMSRVQGACVDCGGQLSYEEGCVKCHSCGFTECG